MGSLLLESQDEASSLVGLARPAVQERMRQDVSLPAAVGVSSIFFVVTLLISSTSVQVDSFKPLSMAYPITPTSFLDVGIYGQVANAGPARQQAQSTREPSGCEDNERESVATEPRADPLPTALRHDSACR